MTTARLLYEYEKLATLTVHQRTPEERAAIAAWLERLADALRNEGNAYAPRFTAGYWEETR